GRSDAANMKSASTATVIKPPTIGILWIFICVLSLARFYTRVLRAFESQPSNAFLFSQLY
ncbi:MAG: hypothetical protein QGI31_10470, partial [Dehalococcoidia bacterium]|nr:hypothetical protein [Dehalococcoidia bacterium]